MIDRFHYLKSVIRGSGLRGLRCSPRTYTVPVFCPSRDRGVLGVGSPRPGSGLARHGACPGRYHPELLLILAGRLSSRDAGAALALMARDLAKSGHHSGRLGRPTPAENADTARRGSLHESDSKSFMPGSS